MKISEVTEHTCEECGNVSWTTLDEEKKKQEAFPFQI